MTDRSALRVRRAAVAAATIGLAVLLATALGDPGAHMAQNLLVPGAGLLEVSRLLAVAVLVATTAAIVVWVTWGIDWLPAVMVVGSTAAAGLLTGDHAATPAGPAAHALVPVAAAHEFPLVVLVITGIVWLRTALGRVPGARRLAERRRRRTPTAPGIAGIGQLPPVDRSRAAAIAVLAARAASDDRLDELDPAVIAAAAGDDVERRARRIGLVARGRTGDPFAVDHAAARAALALTGQLDDEALSRFVHDARTSAAGVPASEPTWVRPLDATLAAAALVTAGDHDAGRRWQAMLARPLALQRGHRPASWWTPLGLRLGSAPVWEHAAMTAIARSYGWCDDTDWHVLRPRLLGAAARGSSLPADERAIAAARLWLVHVDDDQAARIVGRPTVHRDPLAVALDRLATALAARPPESHQHRPRLTAEEGDLVP